MPFRTMILLAAGLALAPDAAGQCAPARAEALLDANDVRATVYGDGSLFYSKGSESGYAVPKGSGGGAVFAGNVWVAGLVGGEPRAAAGIYTLTEFAPGPLAPGAASPDAAHCAAWDRIFEVTTDDFHALAEGVLTDNIRDWPWRAGAPVIDGDGIADNYDPRAGDRPELIGDQRLWWVMNDVGTFHHSTFSDPLGIEVQASAMARAGLEPAVDQATIWRFRIVNRSPDSIERAYMGLRLDTDLGDNTDDLIGMDTTLGLAFTYNADNEDLGPWGYGTAPPAFGLILLDDADGASDDLDNDLDGTVDEADERVGIAHFIPPVKPDCGVCDPGPYKPQWVHNALRGRWWDGSPIVHGGDGNADSFGGSPPPPTRHVFPGDPVSRAFWSEVNADSSGGSRAPGDRRWLLSAGPFRLEPGGEITFTWAMVFARGTDHLDSITRLRRAARGLKDGRSFLLRPTDPAAYGPEPQARYELETTAVHPNPADEQASMRFSLPGETSVRLSVIDLLGRERAVLVDGVRAAGLHNVDLRVGGLEAGVYFVRLVAGRAVNTQKLAVVR